MPRGGSKPKVDFTKKEVLILIEEMARDGLEDQQIAAKFNYSKEHWCVLKRKYTTLVSALEKGRKPLNYFVESSLFKRATGLKVKSTTTKQIRDKQTGEIIAEEVTTTENELPPDTGAIAFWLKQRKSDKWNKEPEKHEVSGSLSFGDFLKKVSKKEE